MIITQRLLLNEWERKQMITSMNNKAVRDVIQLNQKAKARNKQGLFVAEGVKMFAEAPAGRIEKVYIAQRMEEEMMEQYRDKLCKLSCEIVADEVFDKMADTKTPQGVLCLVRQFRYNIEDMLAGKYRGSDKGMSIVINAPHASGTEKQRHMLFIILEDMQDPGNLGTVFRTGEGAGVDGIIMSGNTVDVYNPKTIRSTMGSVYRVPFLYVEEPVAAIRTLQQHGISVYAAHLKKSRCYDTFDYRGGTAFLIGNESMGLKEETAQCADAYLKIPMEGKVESLNAAIASSILLYEAHRQRRECVREQPQTGMCVQ